MDYQSEELKKEIKGSKKRRKHYAKAAAIKKKIADVGKDLRTAEHFK